LESSQVASLVGRTAVRVLRRAPFSASLSAKWTVPPTLGMIHRSAIYMYKHKSAIFKTVAF
jgi:hypothetical protein